MPEKANDKTNSHSENKSDKDAGQRTPGGVAVTLHSNSGMTDVCFQQISGL